MEDGFGADLGDFDMPIHLVLDGALVANIDDRLRSYDLVGRPLFRETAHRATVLAGPWMISLGLDRRLLERAVVAARSIGKGVFWLGEPDDELVFRHLRRLGAARMPDGRILYFRHYDSDVLAATAPLLERQQAAVLFGPCKVIALIGGSGNRATIERPDGLPREGQYPIEFESWQISVLDERQRTLSRKKIAKMLREELPSETRHIADDDRLVKDLCEQAVSGNMTTEASQARWCYMHYLSDGELNKDFLATKEKSLDCDSNLNKYFSAMLEKTEARESIKEYFK